MLSTVSLTTLPQMYDRYRLYAWMGYLSYSILAFRDILNYLFETYDSFNPYAAGG